MKIAIIGGTGFYHMHGGQFEAQTIVTPYGEALVYIGQGEDAGLIFLARHGPEHTIPPHKINYRANIKALQQLGVERVIALFAVGSLHTNIPPKTLVVLDQFVDFTQGRAGTFFDGGASGLTHVEVSNPYCAGLRRQLIALAPDHALEVKPYGTYACFNGPRFETAAEVRMAALLGGDVVGMTGVPEAPLAREVGLHYAGLALSINWGAGIEGPIQVVRKGMTEIRAKMLALSLAALRDPTLAPCDCAKPQIVIQPSQAL
jgi:5'-methylthioadenosine phosphorylase